MEKMKVDSLFKQLALVAGFFLLTSCSNVPGCCTQSGTRLNVDEPRDVTIYADRPWNDTSILVEPGVEYSFSVSNGAIWYDAGISSTANGYSKMKLAPFAPFRRNFGAPWFALICTVDFKDDFRVFDDSPCFGSPPELACADKSLAPQETCTQSHGNFTRTGTLYCYANDVSAMYGNNSGTVEITVMKK